MATTTPFPFGALYDPDAHDYDARHATVVAAVIEWYESHLADSDKASSTDDASYWQGAADACFDVLCLLTEPDPALVLRYQGGEDVTENTGVSPADEKEN